MKQLTGITLFSGMGGSALGLEAAGVKELYFNDYEKHAIDCLRQNFPGLPAKCYDSRSIMKVKGSEILEWTGKKPRQIDFLQMSPPCTSFSNLNSKYETKANAAVNELYSEGLRIAEELKPKVIIIENVPGFFHNSRVFFEALAAIDNIGYVCDGWVLDSAYYGCLQSRPRAWIVAYRKDLKTTPTKPKKTSKPKAVGKIFPYVKFMFMPQFQGVLLPNTKPLPTITKAPNVFFIYDGTKVPNLSANALRTLQFDDELIRQMAAKPNDHYMKLPTIGELMVLSGVRKDYVFPGDSYIAKWNRLGNAVLPSMMQTLVEHIKGELQLT